MCSETLKAVQNILWVWMKDYTKQKKNQKEFLLCKTRGIALIPRDAKQNMWNIHTNSGFSSFCRRWREVFRFRMVVATSSFLLSLWMLHFCPRLCGPWFQRWSGKLEDLGCLGIIQVCSTVNVQPCPPSLPKSAMNGKPDWECLSQNALPTK